MKEHTKDKPKETHKKISKPNMQKCKNCARVHNCRAQHSIEQF